MSMPLNDLLREIHRLRRHLRDLRTEVANLPRAKKAHEAKVAKHEKTVKDAQDLLKKLKSANNDREVSLKSTHQQLQKYEKQLNDMTAPKEIEARQTEIANAKKHISELEEQIFLGMGEIDEQAGKIPALEDQLKRVKAEYATFDADLKEREARLTKEVALAADELKKLEPQLPPVVRPMYDRLVKAHDADALASMKERDRSCSNCHTASTAQTINDLQKGLFVCCNSCGRILFLVPA